MNSPFNAQQLDLLYDFVTSLNGELKAYGLELVDGHIRKISRKQARETRPSLRYYDALWQRGQITVLELAREGLRPTADGENVEPIKGVRQPVRY